MSLRFYCPDPPRAGRYWLPADEARHLVRVCRKNVGDRVELFDGSGFATLAQVVEVVKDRVSLVAEGPPIPEGSRSFSLTVATAIPKGERFDWLVEKATELGADRLIPLITERSVVDPRETKLDRLRRTIVEACKQSGRNRLMVLESPMAWPDLVRSEKQGVRLLAVPHGLSPARWPRLAGRQGLLLAVGPEGGFTPAEEQQATDAGWHAIQFSSNVLRIETAAIVGSAVVMAIFREHDNDGRS